MLNKQCPHLMPKLPVEASPLWVPEEDGSPAVTQLLEDAWPQGRRHIQAHRPRQGELGRAAGGPPNAALTTPHEACLPSAWRRGTGGREELGALPPRTSQTAAIPSSTH